MIEPRQGPVKRWRALARSLRARVVLLVVLATIPALALLIQRTSVERRVLDAQVGDDVFRMARLAGAYEEQLIEGARQLLTALASDVEIEGAEASCAPVFRLLLLRNPQYENIGLADAKGDVICTALPVEQKVNLSDRDYFREAVDARDFAVGDYQVGRITHVATVNFGYPVLGPEGQVIGVIYAAVQLGWLASAAARAELPPGSVVAVVDGDGVLLARHPERGKGTPVGGLVTDTELFRQVVQHREGVVDATGFDGTGRVYGYTFVPRGAKAVGIYVLAGVPPEVAFGELRRLAVRDVFALLGVVLLALVAAWFGGNLFVVRPLQRLVEVTRMLRTGDFTHRTGLPHRGGEIHQLARAVDEMADALAAANANLRARVDELGAVANAARAIVRNPELKAVAAVVVEEARVTLGSERSVLWLANPEESTLELIAQRGLSGDEEDAARHLRFDEDHPASRAASDRRLVRGDGTTAGSFLAIPLAFRGRLVGVLSVAARASGSFGPDQERLASALGDLFAAAVENARLFQEVREALWLREAFIAAAAHELRTPATSLRGYAQLLMRIEAQSEQQRRLLQRISRISERTSRLARELVEAHSLAQGRRLRYEAFDLYEILDEAISAARARAGSHRFVFCAAGPVRIEADRERLGMVFEALLDNAVRYQARGGDIHVVLAADERQAQVEVRDFGAGIPAERLPHVFQPLFEAWPPGSPHYTGVVGLGLYLANAIATAHGGSLEVRSEVGQGSAFVMQIPLRPPT